MTVFYRYVRPKRLDERRGELITLPHGGIALRFEELPEGDLFFTHARCHPTDYFNKDVARLITDDRAAVARSDARVLEHLRHIPYSHDTDLLVHAVIGRCRRMDISQDAPLVQRYMQHEYQHLGEVLSELRDTNDYQERRAAAWKAAIANLWKTAYQENSK